MSRKLDLPQGTLDLILKAGPLGPPHGCGILRATPGEL